MKQRQVGLEGCGNCERLKRYVAELQRRIAGLQARNRALVRQVQREQSLRARAEQRLAQLRQVPRPTASNSSLAPSANPPGAAKPTHKKPTGRRPGGQIGHRGSGRKLLAPERVHDVQQHRPAVCARCQAPLGPKAPGAVVGRHQVAELPEVAVVVIEHQSLACRCGRCGKVSRGTIPPWIQSSVVGPRLTALIGVLGAAVKGSRRAVAEVLEKTLGCPISLGSIVAKEQELSAALAGPYEQLGAAVSEAAVKYVDETGWKLRGKDRWLWVAASSRAVVFRIDATRTHGAMLRLLGGQARGQFCTDRAGIYDLLKPRQRQLCWAHLKRDFTAVWERGGAGAAIGQEAVAISQEVFGRWRDFQRRRLRRGQLQRQIAALRGRMRPVLERGAACGDKKTAGLCRRLLKREGALWRFASVAGLEPSNNLAERMLRPAVIWRKKSFGSHSEAGEVYVQRMLSVIQSLRLQKRDAMAYLTAAVAAHRKGEAAPPILPRWASAKASVPSQPTPLPKDLRKVA